MEIVNRLNATQHITASKKNTHNTKLPGVKIRTGGRIKDLKIRRTDASRVGIQP